MNISWSSMFANGACTVAAYNPSGTLLWTGTLGVSATSPSFTDGTLHCQIVVDANGVVSFQTQNPSPVPGYSVRVTPQYDVSAKYTQAAAISGWGSPSNTGAAFDDASGSSVALAFDAGTGAATPNSVQFSPHGASGSVYVGVSSSQT